MLTALLLIAILAGVIQEFRIPGRARVTQVFRGRKQKRSALVTVPGKSKV